MVGAIVGLILVGLLAGYAARAIIPGRQQMNLLQTLLLGIAGSFIGGALGWLIADGDGGFIQTASWFGSILGAVAILALRAMLEDYLRTSVPRR